MSNTLNSPVPAAAVLNAYCWRLTNASCHAASYGGGYLLPCLALASGSCIYKPQVKSLTSYKHAMNEQWKSDIGKCQVEKPSKIRFFFFPPFSDSF
jgi:hypothetical protein